jgi:hypothetical protein
MPPGLAAMLAQKQAEQTQGGDQPAPGGPSGGPADPSQSGGMPPQPQGGGLSDPTQSGGQGGQPGGGGMPPITLSPQTLQQSGIQPGDLQQGSPLQISATGTVMGNAPNGGIQVQISDLQVQPGSGDPDQDFADAYNNPGPPQS